MKKSDYYLKGCKGSKFHLECRSPEELSLKPSGKSIAVLPPRRKPQAVALVVNMCFLASKEEFAAGDIHACGTQKLGARWGRYGVLKACFITLEVE